MDAKPAESQGRDSNENQAAASSPPAAQPTTPDGRSSEADEQRHVEDLARTSGDRPARDASKVSGEGAPNNADATDDVTADTGAFAGGGECDNDVTPSSRVTRALEG